MICFSSPVVKAYKMVVGIDPDAARELAAVAGYPLGFGFEGGLAEHGLEMRYKYTRDDGPSITMVQAIGHDRWGHKIASQTWEFDCGFAEAMEHAENLREIYRRMNFTVE